MRLLTIALLTFLCTSARAQKLELFESFTNHAVLQRNVDHPMWGWAKPGKVVKVLIGEQKLSVKADKQGRWRVSLPPMPAGGPHKISVQAKPEAILLKDIYFGDVYLLSGQSNMEWRLKQSDSGNKRARAIADPLIRELKVKKAFAGQPLEHLDINEEVSEEWIVGTPEGIREFSAVGSYFAHYLRAEVDVPIGLLHSSWGGSRIEPWMRPATLGMDSGKLTKDLEEQQKSASLPGRKRFANDFPGRDIPTSDDGEDSGWLTTDHDDTAWRASLPLLRPRLLVKPHCFSERLMTATGPTSTESLSGATLMPTRPQGNTCSSRAYLRRARTRSLFVYWTLAAAVVSPLSPKT